MKVLVACEYSGIVRDAFIARGHDALSCDFLTTESIGPHYQGDVRDIIDEGWDLMIAFPPCTYLCSSGMHWTTRGLRDPKLTEDALDFVRFLLDAPINNHPESKKTCLWLKNLPPLQPTNILTKNGKYWDNQTPSGQNKLGPSSDRWNY